MAGETEYRDNYEMTICEWRNRAKSWDYHERFEALGLSGWSQAAPVITYYGVAYVLDPVTGVITEREHPGKKLKFGTLMSIYHLFYYSKERPKASGRWIPFRDVPRAGIFTQAFMNQTVNPFAHRVEGKTDALLAAGEALGFRRIADSDAGFEADVFECLPIRFLFWDGDEEFSARAHVLFDSNVTDFLHEEDVVLIAADGLERLAEEAEKQGGASCQ